MPTSKSITNLKDFESSGCATLHIADADLKLDINKWRNAPEHPINVTFCPRDEKKTLDPVHLYDLQKAFSQLLIGRYDGHTVKSNKSALELYCACGPDELVYAPTIAHVYTDIRDACKRVSAKVSSHPARSTHQLERRLQHFINGDKPAQARGMGRKGYLGEALSNQMSFMVFAPELMNPEIPMKAELVFKNARDENATHQAAQSNDNIMDTLKKKSYRIGSVTSVLKDCNHVITSYITMPQDVSPTQLFNDLWDAIQQEKNRLKREMVSGR